MKNNFDYQWPQCFLKEHSFSLNDSKKSTTKLINFIENFFYDKFKSPVIVFPSARSCIGAILEFEKLNRNDEVYVSKWVSNCIFSSIGFYSNPTVNFIKPKVVLANNNWGLIQKFKFSSKKNTIIIDDSCDSLINDNKDLYTNKSKYSKSNERTKRCEEVHSIVKSTVAKSLKNECNKKQKSVKQDNDNSY